MSERNHGVIIDFSLGAFDRNVAIAYGYDKPRQHTPRQPVARMYTEHRAHSSWQSIEEHKIRWNDVRLRALGLVCIEDTLNDDDFCRAVAMGAASRSETDTDDDQEAKELVAIRT